MTYPCSQQKRRFITTQMIMPYQRTYMTLTLHLTLGILIEESQTIINLLKANHTIVKSEQSQAILVSKRKNTIPEDLTICINDGDIKQKNLVKLLGITLDNKLNFENRISSICKQDVDKMHY